MLTNNYFILHPFQKKLNFTPKFLFSILIFRAYANLLLSFRRVKDSSTHFFLPCGSSGRSSPGGENIPGAVYKSPLILRNQNILIIQCCIIGYNIFISGIIEHFLRFVKWEAILLFWFHKVGETFFLEFDDE